MYSKHEFRAHFSVRDFENLLYIEERVNVYKLYKPKDVLIYIETYY